MTGLNHSDLSEKTINTLRILSAEMVEKAKSGHPGMPMGAAPLAYVLWKEFLQFSPKNPKWANRDRFVLSAGHGSALLYSLLYLTGFELSLDDLKNFRQWQSPCAGHPEFGKCPGVETTTGPLAQGFANAVGMAMAERYLGALFNRKGFELFNYSVYCIAGDGCLMEGLSSEASSLAGHLGLGKLIVLYDSNRISIDGATDLTFTEDVAKRYEAYGWQVLRAEGLDLSQIRGALKQAKSESDKPSLIICKTHIGYGSPNKQDSAASHGAPLGEEELRLTKEKLGWEKSGTFQIPQDVFELMHQCGQEGDKKSAAWQDLRTQYENEFPNEGKMLRDALAGRPPEGFAEFLPSYGRESGALPTRKASGQVINALSAKLPLLLGGSADLAESNNTLVKGEEPFSKNNPLGKNIFFGVREHAMAAILNGMALSDLVIPFAGTFLIFSDYMRPSIRLSAIMGLPVIYVFTHDSFFLGEDGPTHQPIEHLAALRAIPNLYVLRPADAKETVAAWHFMLKNKTVGPKAHPFALCLSRQNLPILEMSSENPDKAIAKGGYTVFEEKSQLEIIYIASGSEVSLCVAAAQALSREGKGVRVISMPCRELFFQQDQAYQEKTLPPEIDNRIVVEAAIPLGWEKIAGPKGKISAIERFGASAPASVLGEKFGFHCEKIIELAKA